MNFDQAMDKATPILKNQMGSGGVCSFGFLGDNFHKAHHADVCHARVQNADARTEYFYSTVTPKRDDKLFDEIYDFTVWALGDTGPWKTLVKDRDRAVVVDKDAVVGFVLEVDKNDSAALLRNMCMALRLTGEHRSNFEAYLRLRSIGLNEVDSFYVANQYSDRGGKAVESGVANSNHIIVPNPLDFHLTRFEEGNPYEKKEALVGGKYDYNDYNRTTGVFRLKSSSKARYYGDDDHSPIKLKKLNELVGKGGLVKGRWHKTNLDNDFDRVAKVYMDDFKPAYVRELGKIAA